MNDSARKAKLPWKSIVAILFYGALFVALYFYVQTMDLRALAQARFDWYWLVAAILLGTAVKLLYPQVWRVLLHGLGIDIPHSGGLYQVYAMSWIGRYTPGKAAMIGARVLYAEKVGATKSQAFTSFLVEQGLQISAGSGIGVLLLALARQAPLPDFVYWLMILIAAAVPIVLKPEILQKLAEFAFRLIGREAPGAFPPTGPMLRAMGLQTVIQIGTGAYTVLVAWSLFGPDALGPAALLHAWGVFGISIVIGMLAVFAPAGLGAREAVQLAMLGAILPAEHAALFVVLHRATELASDALFFFIATYYGVRAQTGSVDGK